jgi:hypothetical protein
MLKRFGVCVFMFLALLSIVPVQLISAQPVGKVAENKANAETWAARQALLSCFSRFKDITLDGTAFPGSLTETGSDSGTLKEFLEKYNGASIVDSSYLSGAGWLLAPDDDERGRLPCNKYGEYDEEKRTGTGLLYIIRMAGLTEADFLDILYSPVDGGERDLITEIDEADFKTKMDEKAGGQLKFSPSMKYPLYYEALIRGCGVDITKPADTAGGDNAYKVTTYDPTTGDQIVGSYIGTLGRGDKTNVFAEANSSESGFLSCEEIEKRLNGSAGLDAYEILVKDDIENDIVPDPTTDGGGEEETPTCGGASGGGIGDVLATPMTWVMCGIAGALTSTIEWAEKKVIVPYLSISPLSQGDVVIGVDGEPVKDAAGNEKKNAVRRSWVNIRNLANILLVVVFFILVYLQITAGSSNNAYSVRKIAPKIVFATIAIQLSYFIGSFLIDLFNILGLGVAQFFAATIIETSPDSLAYSTSSVDNAAIYAAVLGTGIAAVGSMVASGAIGIASVFGFLVMAVIVIIGVVFVLVLRQILVIGLVVISPLAFVAMLLPNTESLFKKWFSMLIKLLAMQPIIIAIFSVGKILSSFMSTVNVTGTGSDSAAGIMSFIANVAPLAAIPWAFKFAGGAMGAGFNAVRGLGQNSRKKVLDPKSNFLNTKALNDIDDRRRTMKAQRKAVKHQAGRGFTHKALHTAQALHLPGSKKLGGYMDQSNEMHYAHAAEEAEKMVGTIFNDNSAQGAAWFARFGGSKESYKQGLEYLNARVQSGQSSKEDLAAYRDMGQFAGQELYGRAALKFAAQKKKVGDEDRYPANFAGRRT